MLFCAASGLCCNAFQCRAFPCWDEPGVKATFSLALIIPAHLTALSNMPEISTTHVAAPSAAAGASAGGSQQMLKKVVFEKTPKMSTYLLAWAVGELDFIQGTTKGGVTIRVFAPPGRGPQGHFALDVAIRALDFYDGYFKVSKTHCYDHRLKISLNFFYTKIHFLRGNVCV